MLYRAKILILKWTVWLATKLPTITQKLVTQQKYSPSRVVPIVENEIRAAHIRRYVTGKTFLDAGCMYTTNGAYTFYAEQCGAKRSVGLDVTPASSAFKEYKESHQSSVQFIQGDINDAQIIDLVRDTDVVFCNGVLYHTPDPFMLLTRLREMCQETLLLYTATIPEIAGLQNTAVFYPYLSNRHREFWNPHKGSRPGVTEPYKPEIGYGNWFWGLSPSCVVAMLQCAGFRIESVVRHRPFAHLFVCHVDPTKARSVSDPEIYRNAVRQLPTLH